MYLVKQGSDRVESGQKDDPPQESEPARLQALCTCIPRVGDILGDLCTRVIIEIGRGVEKLHWFVITVVKRGSDRVESGQRDDPPLESELARLRALCTCIPRVEDTFGDLCTQIITGLYILSKTVGGQGRIRAKKTMRPRSRSLCICARICIYIYS